VEAEKWLRRQWPRDAGCQYYPAVEPLIHAYYTRTYFTFERSRRDGVLIPALSMHTDVSCIRAALPDGASGYVAKSVADMEVLTASKRWREDACL